MEEPALCREERRHPELQWEDPFGKVHVIPLETIASWMELLGYSDALDAIDAITSVRYNSRGGSPVDQETGENDFTESFLVLAERERTRQAEAERAIKEGTANDPRSPKLRAAYACRARMLELTGCEKSSETLLSRCQEGARAGLEVCTPNKPPSAASRETKPCCCPCTHTVDPPKMLNAQDRLVLAEALAPYMEELHELRKEFLASVSGRDVDVLAAFENPVMAPTETASLESVVNKYSNEEDHHAA